MKKLLFALLFLAFPAFSQVSLSIDGKSISKASISISTDIAVVVVPPTCITGTTWNGSACVPVVVTPPPSGYVIAAVQDVFWGRGNAPNTIQPPCPILLIPNGVIQPYRIATASLLVGTSASIQLYGNSANMKVNISATPGDMGSPGGVKPYLNALSGSDLIKFVASDNGSSDSALASSGYKRLPVLGQYAYINVQADGTLPAQITALLYFGS